MAAKNQGIIYAICPSQKIFFEEEISISIGRSMLRRFQMEGQTLENEFVSDRLLLNYCL